MQYENLKYYYYVNKKQNIYCIALFSNRRMIGYISPWHVRNKDWEIVTVVAEHGYGYKMHEAAMDMLYPQWIIPLRNKEIHEKLIHTYTNFLRREDIETQKIKPFEENYVKVSLENDDWFNRRYRLKNRLNIDFIKDESNSIKRIGLKFFSDRYEWKSNRSSIK